jgi:hypothetical protein
MPKHITNCADTMSLIYGIGSLGMDTLMADIRMRCIIIYFGIPTFQVAIYIAKALGHHQPILMSWASLLSKWVSSSTKID